MKGHFNTRVHNNDNNSNTVVIVKAVELEIQKIEAAQAKRHVQLLTAFLPETFVRRGGSRFTDLILS